MLTYDYSANLLSSINKINRLTSFPLICRAIKNCDVIICDEIGPMELKSRESIDSVKNLIVVNKKVIVVVHHKLQHPLI